MMPHRHGAARKDDLTRSLASIAWHGVVDHHRGGVCEFVIAWLFFLFSIHNRVFGLSSEDSPQSTAIILTQELGLAVAAAVASGAVIGARQFLKQGTSGSTALGLLVGTIVVWIITFALTVSHVGS